MALFGLIGTVHPSLTEGRIAAAQFWMHNVGVPVMLGALTLRIKGFQSAEPLIGVASIIHRRLQRTAVCVAGVFVRIGARAESLSSATRDLHA